MKASKGQAITTAVFAGLKIAIAITVFVLIKAVLNTYVEINNEQTGQTITEPGVLQWWLYGLPFMVPGILGLVAAGTRHQAAYGVYMAACIISCIIDAVFCFLSFAFLFAMASFGGLDCEMVAGQCVCSTGLNLDAPTNVGIQDCADVNKLIHMSYGVCAMLILGWVMCLAGSIISCVSCCCGKRDPGGVIVMGAYPGQITVTTAGGPPPQYAAPPPQYATGGDDSNVKTQYKYDRMY